MIWVLSKDYNDYHQYGSYFVAAWLQKPSREQIAELIGASIGASTDAKIDHILAGNGRIDEDESYSPCLPIFTLSHLNEGESL